ncbi:threonine/serine exporter family protein [Streptococcus pluranimalium]|uniref:Threonine/serine exporter n=1 Tax=Streptococcus pluranimalium TaxID=82348 RepID=A0A2L0D4J1_9STRE|nr:threonine/serine exporter family protein [Streptococcus pluranimalium]AUW96509.1 threonine/serine exporter [Streptococcus pluranimalium]MDY3042377.1 threonine/serine exporter family protein [Streptococcus pluranimalium]WFM80744.1 threonine/serine exporter family protein [Streptococcus pluranimalium]HEM6115643.1 threonine/serine exporter family protein [Streptococcus suis]
MIWSFLFQILGAYVATVTAGILLEAPKHLVYQTGFIGAAGYTVYLIFLERTDNAVATLLGGIVIALLSQISARKLASPVTVFYIPSFFPLVPGAGVYRIAYYYIQDNPKLAGENLIESILVSGAIALSIFIVDSFLEIYNHLKQAKH